MTRLHSPSPRRTRGEMEAVGLLRVTQTVRGLLVVRWMGRRWCAAVTQSLGNPHHRLHRRRGRNGLGITRLGMGMEVEAPQGGHVARLRLVGKVSVRETLGLTQLPPHLSYARPS